MELIPIGVIRTPFKRVEDVPTETYFPPSQVTGTIDVFEEFEEGLENIENLSHIVLVYLFHKVRGYSLTVRPTSWAQEAHGLFTTRHPNRPSPIGISVVELIDVTGNTLTVKGLDMLDGSPLLDIKPYLPTFEPWSRERKGTRFL